VRAVRGLFSKSLPDALIERVSGIGIHVVTEDRDTAATPANGSPPRRWIRDPIREVGVPFAAVAVATLLGSAVEQAIDLPNVSLIYLLAVVVSAVYAGSIAALIAAVLSSFAYNFFFILPLETFTIASPHEVFGLVIFFITALLAGGLASRVSAQSAAAARQRAVATQSLYDFSRKLSGTVKADDVVWTAVSQMQASLRRDIVLLTPVDGELTVATAWPPDTELDVTDMTAARWTGAKSEAAGNATGTLPNSTFQFRPLGPAGNVGAVVGIRLAGKPLDPEEEQALRAILDQTAIAIDRARLSKENLDQAARAAGERFRAALLSSISHDLKTPLATISGAVSSLRQLGEKMKPASRADLLASIKEESDTLNRFVSNLLDMTRIEAGTVDPRKDWVDVGDVIHSTLERVKKYFPTSRIETSLAETLPLIRGDSVLLGQVLFNLIDNAIKYGGTEPVALYARSTDGEVVLSVTDMGRGIPEKELDKVFESIAIPPRFGAKFYIKPKKLIFGSK
jgi:two-component system sensor histidine kinase KdpD